jgi:hypothetical protein
MTFPSSADLDQLDQTNQTLNARKRTLFGVLNMDEFDAGYEAHCDDLEVLGEREAWEDEVSLREDALAEIAPLEFKRMSDRAMKYRVIFRFDADQPNTMQAAYCNDREAAEVVYRAVTHLHDCAGAALTMQDPNEPSTWRAIRACHEFAED